MVRGLLILVSSVFGSRDLWWPRDDEALRGYNVYRAEDVPANWQKLNAEPVGAQYYRDQTTLETVRFPVTADNWVDAGEMGMKVVRIPDIPYSEVVKGRPQVATQPEAVQIELTKDGETTYFRPKMVSGIDQNVFFPVGKALRDGGAVSEFAIMDLDGASITLVYKKLVNYVDIAINMRRTFYTVVPVGDRGELHAPGAFDTQVVSSADVDPIDYMQARMVAYNQWIFEQVGEPAYLMFRRTAGQRCGCNPESTQGRSRCPVCYETGIKGGYYGPIDFLFIDPDVNATATIEEGGRKVERQSRSYLGRTPIVQDGDLIIRRNGERLVIAGTTYKRPRGVLLQQDFNVELLPIKDTRYLIPIFTPEAPVLYDPRTTPNPGDGAQPVVLDGSPGQYQSAGMTTTFARIQGFKSRKH